MKVQHAKSWTTFSEMSALKQTIYYITFFESAQQNTTPYTGFVTGPQGKENHSR